MSEVKPVVARTAAQLAEALALPAAEAPEWQVQHAPGARLREIAREQKLRTPRLPRDPARPGPW